MTEQPATTDHAYRLTIVKPYRRAEWSAMIEGVKTFLHLDHKASEPHRRLFMKACRSVWPDGGISDSGDELWVFLSDEAGRALINQVKGWQGTDLAAPVFVMGQGR